jgi:hypothetical protein
VYSLLGSPDFACYFACLSSIKVSDHPFFDPLQLDKVLNKGYTPEFVPPADQLNFSEEFVSQQPLDSAPKGGFLNRSQESGDAKTNFMNWTYDANTNEDELRELDVRCEQERGRTS